MDTLIKNFHFSDPAYLWFLLAIPLFWFFAFKNNIILNSHSYLKKFIDERLLKELLKTNTASNSGYKFLILFSLIWVLLIIALASPRWKFSEQKTYSTNSNLVILLDLSAHMKVRDIAPSRINKAKQIVADILQESQGLNISVTAFAKIPHIIAPLTSDIKTIDNILPYIDTDLPHIEGSDLSLAIKEVAALFPNNSSVNHILLLSSGNLENYTIESSTKDILDKKNIKINTILVATKNGAPLIDQKGEFKKNQLGDITISKAKNEILEQIANNFGGKYLSAVNNLEISGDFLAAISAKKSVNLGNSNNNKIWQEEYYWLVAFAMILLFFLRRNFILILPFLFLIDQSQANIFLNQNQKAKKLFDQGKFKQSSQLFSNSYNSGVAKFRDNNFAGAEAEFQKTADHDINARYNLGNSLFKQHKYSQAKETYQKVLAENPHHQNAKYNLKITEEILKQQPKNNKSAEDSNQKQKNQSHNQQQQKEKNQQKQNHQDKKDKKKKEKSTNQEGKKPSSSQQEKANKEQNKKDKNSNNNNKNDKKNLNKKQKEKNQEKKDYKDKKDKQQQNKVTNKNNKNLKSNNKDEKEAVNNKNRLDATMKQIFQRIESDPRIFLKKKFYYKEKNSL